MIYWSLLIAALLHLVEEYVYPGGFLRWMRSSVGVAPSTIEAVVLNTAFIALVAAPVPELRPSVAGLLLANGVAHVVGTIWTKRYSPGVITSVVLFFPLGAYALVKSQTVSGGILLGIGWMCVPLTVVVLRRVFGRFITQR